LPRRGHILSHLAWEGRLAELSLTPDAVLMIQQKALGFKSH
jgi:hypothetical protein